METLKKQYLEACKQLAAMLGCLYDAATEEYEGQLFEKAKDKEALFSFVISTIHNHEGCLH